VGLETKMQLRFGKLDATLQLMSTDIQCQAGLDMRAIVLETRDILSDI
jgi:hypothetical protein